MASTIVVIPLRQKDRIYWRRMKTTRSGFILLVLRKTKTKLVYEDRTILNVFHTLSTSEDERFAFLTISDRGKGFDGVALFYRDKNSGNKTFLPIVATPGKFQYNVVDNIGDKILLQTNDGVQNSKVVLFDPAKPGMENWKVIIPERAEPLQESVLPEGICMPAI